MVSWTNPPQEVSKRVESIVVKAEAFIPGPAWVRELETHPVLTIAMVIGELRVKQRRPHVQEHLPTEHDLSAYREAAAAVVRSKIAQQQTQAEERLSQSTDRLARRTAYLTAVGVAFTIVAAAAGLAALF